MRKIYSLKSKSLLLSAILAGGLAYGQVYQIAPGELLYPGGVTNEGVVVLSNDTSNFMWSEANGLTTLNTLVGDVYMSGTPNISSDGTRISITATNPTTNLVEMAYYDVATSTITYLGGIGSMGADASSAWGMSKDGQAIVGLGWLNSGAAHAIKWTPAGGIIDLGSTVSGSSSRANGTNSDGSVVVGWQDATSGYRQGAVWSNGTQTLIYDNDGFEVSEAAAVSGDGNWVIGGGFNSQAWRWSESTGIEAISHPNAGMWFNGAATAISDDGAVIIGYYRPWPGPALMGEGFIWTEATGRVNLNDYLENLGMDDEGITFALPMAISPDGTTIVGTGITADFDIIPFMIKLNGEYDPCGPVNVPYYQDFDTAEVPNIPECTSIENAGTGNDWTTYSGTDGGFTGTYLRYQWNASSSANAWFYTQGINLVAGTEYKITYDYGTESAGTFPESLRVAYGTSASSTAMTNILAEHENVATAEQAVENVVEFTVTESGVYYFGFNAYSAANMYNLYLDNIKVELAGDAPEPGEGCLDAPNGQYPAMAYTPNCMGSLEVVEDLGWFGEYSVVNVTAGTEYVFSTDIATAFITIGNSTGTTVLASGTGSVTWTATASEAVRFYTHENDECLSSQNFVERYVQCGEVPPAPETCEENFVASNNLENGSFLGGADAQRIAVDVIVGDAGFTVQGVKLNIFVDGTTDLTFAAKFYNDEAGLPGAEVHATNATIHSSALIGNAFGFDVYEYTISFEQNATLDANSTYWMEIESSGLAWESTSGYFIGAGMVFNNNSTAGDWINDPSSDLVYELICEDLGAVDLSTFDFAYYPNPVKDMLNITSKKGLENVSIFNLAGQQIVNKVKANNNQVDMSTLSAGTYVFKVTLEGGQIETFKIVKK